MKSMPPRTFEEFAEQVRSFHGAVAPGVMVGAFMVDLAYEHLDEEGFYDVICETAKCLPDSVQLLTPCSLGNQWLKVIDVGRYALTFYEKRTGKGVRVFLDSTKLDRWPELKAWFLRLKPKAEQDTELLLREIKEAGTKMCGVEKITVAQEFLKKEKGRAISLCSSCNEAFPSSDGSSLCPACREGALPYLEGTHGNRKA